MVEAATRQTRDADLVRVERLQRLEAEYEKLASENENLRQTNRELGTTYRVLTEEHKTVRTEVHHLKLKKIEYEGVVFDCTNQAYAKEIEANKHTEARIPLICTVVILCIIKQHSSTVLMEIIFGTDTFGHNCLAGG